MSFVEIIGDFEMRYEPLDGLDSMLGGSIRSAWNDALGPSVSLVNLDYNREGSIVSVGDMVDAGVIDECAHFVDHFHIGFKWNEADNSVAYWYPQGITGSYDAVGGHGYWSASSRTPTDGDDEEPADGKRLLLVSWYCRNRSDKGGLADPKGVRISVVDLTEWEEPIRYRHVLLVRPFITDGVLDFEEITYDDAEDGKTSYHVGGIAWYGRYLYVSAGSRGLMVFDLRRVKELEVSDDDRCGLHGGSYHGRGYRYVCPLVAEYLISDEDKEKDAPASFSCVSVDRSGSRHALVGGPFLYPDDEIDTSVVSRWELDDTTGLLAASSGAPAGAIGVVGIGVVGDTYVDSDSAVITGERYMQGVLSVGDRYWLSISYGTLAQMRYYESEHHVETYNWPDGCEDLTYSARSDNLWCLSEFPDWTNGIPGRFVFAVKLSDFSG